MVLSYCCDCCTVFFFKQKTAYEMRIRDWSSDVCSSDLMTNGIRAFLPGSLVDLRPVKDTTPYEGKTTEFKVIKRDRKRNNVVLSRRAVLEASMGEAREKLLETLAEGVVVKAIVTNITDYGAFIHPGGMDGLFHIPHMSYGIAAWRERV